MSEGRGRAKPGALVSAYTCGYTDDDGALCGASATYEIKFSDWAPDEFAGTCSEHAPKAREMGNLERIWTR